MRFSRSAYSSVRSIWQETNEIGEPAGDDEIRVNGVERTGEQQDEEFLRDNEEHDGEDMQVLSIQDERSFTRSQSSNPSFVRSFNA